MFQAALLDAWPDAGPGLEAAMRAAGLPEDWSVEIRAAGDGVLTGTHLAIRAPATGERRPTGAFREIRERLARAPLTPAVGMGAIAILTLLAEAEAAVHGVAVDDVHFHELADWDSIADVVGAAYLIDWLSPAGWSVGPLPMGGGRVDTAHGPLPVPAPATAKLLAGFEVLDDGIGGERVTPTGAAILRHLAPSRRPPAATLTLGTEGTGLGSRKLDGIANALRALGLYAGAVDGAAERVAVIDFEIDDQAPEDLAIGLDRLRQLPDVLDVLQVPAFGKKGRLVAGIQLLSRPEAVSTVAEACFEETTTIGLRWRIEDRIVLERRIGRTETADGQVSVKLVDRPSGARTAKAEIDDLAAAPGGRAGRDRRRLAAETKALCGDRDGDG
jgi:hypothetical protein